MASWWFSSPLMVAPVVSSIMSTIKRTLLTVFANACRLTWFIEYRIVSRTSRATVDMIARSGRRRAGRGRGWESGLDVSNKAVFSPCRGKTSSEIRREQSTGESPVRHGYNPPKNLCNSATSEWPPLALHLSNFQFFSEKPPLTSGSSWKLAVCRSFKDARS